MDSNTVFEGLVIASHRIRDARTKLNASKSLFGWQSVKLTPRQWVSELEQGHIIQPSLFVKGPNGQFHHSLETWRGTHFVCADADYLKGVEFSDDGLDKNPNGVEFWTEEGQLSKRYPDLVQDCYAAVQSVSSMSMDKPPPHKRFRLIFLFDKMIVSESHYHQVLLALSEKYPIIPPTERAPSQPVYGNARQETAQAFVAGNILSLSDFPFQPPEPKSEPNPEPKSETSRRRSGGERNVPDRSSSRGDSAITKTIREWLDEHKIPFTEKAYKGTYKYQVDCPHDASHKSPDAWITDEGGTWQFSCSHDSCKGDRSTWAAFKAAHGIKSGEVPRERKKKRENPIPEMKDASQYFIHDEFNVLAMSEFIQETFTVWAQDSGIYIYDKNTGTYLPGEMDIDLAVRVELGQLRKARHVEEVLKDLAATCRRSVPDTSHLIGFRNGVLRLHLEEGTLGTFTEHSADNYLMSTFPVDFSLDAEFTEGAADFEAWMREVLSEDHGLHRVLYEVIGSIFHKGSVAMQRGVLLVGEGGTGKSMLLSQVERMVGDANICARAWTDFGVDLFAMGNIYGKSLVLDADIDVSKPLSGSIKPAITGNPISCNKKHKQAFDFNPFATWIGSINKFPRTRDKTWGFFRRWIAVPFNKTFPTDSRFEVEKRRIWSDPATVTRIVLDALTHYVLAYRNGTYTVPEAAAELAREMYQSANSVISWLDSETRAVEGAILARTEAYQAYGSFCAEKNYDSENTRNFYATLRSQGYVVDHRARIDGKQERVIEGLVVRGVEESDFQDEISL